MTMISESASLQCKPQNLKFVANESFRIQASREASLDVQQGMVVYVCGGISSCSPPAVEAAEEQPHDDADVFGLVVSRQEH